MREVFNDTANVYINNTKSYIGHAMGGAAALELAGNLPSFEDGIVPGQNACMRAALDSARTAPDEVDIVSTHATSTQSGDVVETKAVRAVFGDATGTFVNNTKSYIGHAMGGAGALELAGNLPSFIDGIVHPTINVDNLDPDCEVRNLVMNEPRDVGEVRTILNMSFGMLGINSAVIIRRFES